MNWEWLFGSKDNRREGPVRVRDLLESENESWIDDAFFDGQCTDYFTLDWRSSEDELVNECERVICSDKLSCEQQSDSLLIRYGNAQAKVALDEAEGSLHSTACMLNDLLEQDYQIRFVVSSHGSDVIGFCVLPQTEWEELEQEFPGPAAENYLDPRSLPNIVTELTDERLPAASRARHERMIARYKKRR